MIGPREAGPGPPTVSATILMSAAAPTTVTATLGAFLSRTGLVHGQGASLEVLLMEHADGFGGIFLRAHLNEGESARAARSAILHDNDRDHSARLGEEILQVVFGCRERKIPHE